MTAMRSINKQNDVSHSLIPHSAAYISVDQC